MFRPVTCDSGVIYEKDSGRIVKHFDTVRGARICFTKKYKIGGHKQMYVACSYAEYAETGGVTANEDVEVTSIFGKKVTIRKVDVGGPCDPSTERYWSM